MSVFIAVFLKFFSYKLSVIFLLELENFLKKLFLSLVDIYRFRGFIFLILFFLFLFFLLFVDLIRNLFCLLVRRDERVNFYFGCNLCSFRFAFICSKIDWMWNIVYFGNHDSKGRHKCTMKWILRIELFDGFRGSLRKLPKWLSIFCLSVQWICVEKLFNIISEVFVEFVNSVVDATFKIDWMVFQ